MSTRSQTIPTQGLHHITLTGAGRKITLDFWEGVLGMPLVFEQPNLDKPDESHLYFDPGDDRLITVFCDEKRTALQGKFRLCRAQCITLRFRSAKRFRYICRKNWTSLALRIRV